MKIFRGESYIIIKLNNALVHTVLMRIASSEGVSITISSEIEGFSIERDGEVISSGDNKRDFHVSLMDLIKERKTN